MITVNEIFFSIQGESTQAGRPCVFVRLTYCNLRCSYCDTDYAFFDGKEMTIQEIINEIKNYDCNLVEITGGEPLMQNECFELMYLLCNENFDVLLETSGSILIEKVDKRVKIILDVKCPSSGMMKKNLYSNYEFLKPIDEIKFVIGDRNDFDWSKEIVLKYDLTKKCDCLFSPVYGKIEPSELVKWILNENLKVRFQLQIHKYIWDIKVKGV